MRQTGKHLEKKRGRFEQNSLLLRHYIPLTYNVRSGSAKVALLVLLYVVI